MVLTEVKDQQQLNFARRPAGVPASRPRQVRVTYLIDDRQALNRLAFCAQALCRSQKSSRTRPRTTAAPSYRCKASQGQLYLSVSDG